MICKLCGKKAIRKVNEEWLCAKHYVEIEGKGECLEQDLLILESQIEDIERENKIFHKKREIKFSKEEIEILKEIKKQFPALAKKYKKIFDIIK